MSILPAATYPLSARFPDQVRDYLERISGMDRLGEAREESFYPELADLLRGYAEHRGLRDLGVLILPRKTDDCLLDLQVRRGEAIVGYVEAKRPGTDLGPVAETDQLKRYRAAFPNLLLTNFRELRLYRGNELAARADAGHAGPRAAPHPARPLLRLRAAPHHLGGRAGAADGAPHPPAGRPARESC